MRKHLHICAILLFTGAAFGGVDVFFSPKGGCEGKIVSMLNGSKSQVDAAIYSLNNSAIIEAMKDAHNRGVKVRVLLDRTQSFGNKEATLGLVAAGIEVRIHSKNRIQHNKFGVFDSNAVITGSFNWTNSAEEANEENCLTSDDPATVAKFSARFRDYLWVVNTAERSLTSLVKMGASPKTEIGEKNGNQFKK